MATLGLKSIFFWAEAEGITAKAEPAIGRLERQLLAGLVLLNLFCAFARLLISSIP
jgi:hypothetical protein